MHNFLIGTVMEIVSPSEKLVSIYQIMWHNIPEDSHLQKGSLFKELIHGLEYEGYEVQQFLLKTLLYLVNF